MIRKVMTAGTVSIENFLLFFKESLPALVRDLPGLVRDLFTFSSKVIKSFIIV
jgi:hypothetical protein